VPALIVAGVISLSWNGLAFTAAAETAGIARSGAALGFQQTVLGVLYTAGAPAFAALVAATSWRVAFEVAAVFPLVGVLVLLRVQRLLEPGEDAKCRRSHRQLVELRVDAAELPPFGARSRTRSRAAHRER